MTLTLDEIVVEIRSRFKIIKEEVARSKVTAPDSYGAGYDLGYHDALGELLEFITED